jgi:glycosyltransferase involved in cell wall biosynthesis
MIHKFGKTPLISVITPVYNGADYLDELITSVLQQDYKHFEHIIIDDGSSDNGATIAVLKKYPHLRWWSRSNKGQYATINEGLVAASGDILVVISADDLFASHSTFRSVIEYWQKNPESAGVYGRTLLMDSSGNVGTRPLYPTLRVGALLPRLIRYAPIFVQHCSLFIAKSLVVDNKLWIDESFRYAGDWDWMIRLAQTGHLSYLNKSLAIYREHPFQVSQQAGRKKMFVESQRILQFYKANYWLYSCFVLQQRISKAVYLLLKTGFSGLVATFKNWL